MKATRPRPARVIADRVTVDRYDAPYRHLERGVELTVAGIRGRVAFVAYTRHENGREWLDVLTARGKSRVIRPDAVETVHRTRTGVLPA